MDNVVIFLKLEGENIQGEAFLTPFPLTLRSERREMLN
jgi:hypothetical protein